MNCVCTWCTELESQHCISANAARASPLTCQLWVLKDDHRGRCHWTLYLMESFWVNYHKKCPLVIPGQRDGDNFKLKLNGIKLCVMQFLQLWGIYFEHFCSFVTSYCALNSAVFVFLLLFLWGGGGRGCNFGLYNLRKKIFIKDFFQICKDLLIELQLVPSRSENQWGTLLNTIAVSIDEDIAHFLLFYSISVE